MVKQIINPMRFLIIIITIFLCCVVIVSGTETKANLIMNAFMDFKNKGYDDQLIKQKIIAVVSGKENIEKHEWDNFLQKFKDLNNNPNVPKGELYKYEIAIIEAKKMVVNLLTEVTNDRYSELTKNPIKKTDGTTYFNIPEDIDNYKEYLGYALEILKQPCDILDYHPDSEDLKKVEINIMHSLDLYSKSLEKYVKLLKSLKNNDKKIQKLNKKEYEKANRQYQIESQRIIVYVSQKGRELANKYSFKDEYDAEILEKSLMQLEKRYESKN